MAQHFIKIFIMIALSVLLTSPVWGVIEKHPRKAVPVMIYDQLETAQPSKGTGKPKVQKKKRQHRRQNQAIHAQLLINWPN